MAKAKTPRFYIPQAVRETVNEIAAATGLSQGEVIEGAVAHLLNDHRRTGQPPGPALTRLIQHAKERDAKERGRALIAYWEERLAREAKEREASE